MHPVYPPAHTSGIFYLAAGADTPVAVADVTNARGLALSLDGRRLWVARTLSYGR